MADVFISYKRQDREWVKRIADALEAEHYSVWWDSSLRAGEFFDAEIDRQLAAARCVVVIWSLASRSSRWVKSEALEGYDKDKLVAARIDDVSLGRIFNDVHVCDLREPDGFGKLTDGVIQKIGNSRKPTQQDTENLGVIKRWWIEWCYRDEDLEARIIKATIHDSIEAIAPRLSGIVDSDGDPEFADEFLELVGYLVEEQGGPESLYFCETLLDLVRTMFAPRSRA